MLIPHCRGANQHSERGWVLEIRIILLSSKIKLFLDTPTPQAIALSLSPSSSSQLWRELADPIPISSSPSHFSLFSSLEVSVQVSSSLQEDQFNGQSLGAVCFLCLSGLSTQCDLGRVTSLNYLWSGVALPHRLVVLSKWDGLWEVVNTVSAAGISSQEMVTPASGRTPYPAFGFCDAVFSCFPPIPLVPSFPLCSYRVLGFFSFCNTLVYITATNFLGSI